MVTWDVDDNNNISYLKIKLPVDPSAPVNNPNLPANGYIGFKNNQLVECKRSRRNVEVNDSNGTMNSNLNMFNLETLLSNLDLNEDNTIPMNLQMRSITNSNRSITNIF